MIHYNDNIKHKKQITMKNVRNKRRMLTKTQRKETQTGEREISK